MTKVDEWRALGSDDTHRRDPALLWKRLSDFTTYPKLFNPTCSTCSVLWRYPSRHACSLPLLSTTHYRNLACVSRGKNTEQGQNVTLSQPISARYHLRSVVLNEMQKYLSMTSKTILNESHPRGETKHWHLLCLRRFWRNWNRGFARRSNSWDSL